MADECLLNPPPGVDIVATPDPDALDAHPRPEVFAIGLCGPMGERPTGEQLLRIAATMEKYVRQVGNRSKPNDLDVRKSQGAELGSEVAVIDTVVPGDWDRVKNHNNCIAINSLASALRQTVAIGRELPTFRFRNPFPTDLVLAVGITNFPCKRQREILTHEIAGNKTFLLMDAVARVVIPEHDIRFMYFTIQLLHRADMIEPAHKINTYLMNPLCTLLDSYDDMFSDFPPTTASDEDFKRNTREILTSGGLMARANGSESVVNDRLDLAARALAAAEQRILRE
ncbi:hypothetical protein C1H76_0210 [Elsinoe australis]|uniref:Uncharacterized protein n=1 Tax=Elsinoe australis TaxID=40998 RepID=A0A4U7B7C0_9PEZI|nr:hypothetical protein C1H76_0210 [Elsinoe australis]